jgi:hypothetical protein
MPRISSSGSLSARPVPGFARQALALRLWGEFIGDALGPPALLRLLGPGRADTEKNPGKARKKGLERHGKGRKNGVIIRKTRQAIYRDTGLARF